MTGERPTQGNSHKPEPGVQAQPDRSPVGPVLGGVLLVNAAVQILRAFADGPIVSGLAEAMFVWVFLLVAQRLGRRALLALVGIAAAFIPIGLLLEHPAEVLREALTQGGFLSGYISVISLLQAPARRSRAISDLGAFVTLQPPRSRYVWLAISGQVLGALLLFATIALFAPLVSEGVRRSKSDPLRAQLRLERQTLALFRSFAWMLVWAPTTAAMAILHRAFDDLDALRMFASGFALSLVVSIIGWLDDTIRFRGIARRMPDLAVPAPTSTPSPPFPRRASLRFCLVIALLWSGTFGISAVTGAIVTIGLMIACSVTVAIWLAVQHLHRAGRVRTIPNTWRVAFFAELSSAVPQVFILGAVGVVGTYVAAALSDPLSEQVAVLTHVSPLLFLLGLTAIVSSVTLFAVSPMAIIIILASTLASVPGLPVGHTAIALTLLVAWAWSATASPNSFVSILIAQYFCVNRLDMWRANIRFSLVGSVITFAFLAYLATC